MELNQRKIVTCIAPVNIAVIKYWGKRDENLILPLNDSISATLSTEHMCARTTVMASPAFERDEFWLNGEEHSLDNPRIQNCIQQLRSRTESDNTVLQWKLHICSANDFPTAAGLASSAAGYACLVTALATLYGVCGDLSALARLGSGSACRSTCGGWVHWRKGGLPDGSDSVAMPLAVAAHWPEIRVLVVVVSDAAKRAGSTCAMRVSAETSELLAYRVQKLVDEHVTRMVHAIRQKDFPAFGRLVMQDSNQFHAICLDTYPPCVYMNDVSHAIADLVHAYNQLHQAIKVAYTFDAGPNACLFVLEKDVADVVATLRTLFPPELPHTDSYVRGCPVSSAPAHQENKLVVDPSHLRKHGPGLIKYIIHTKIGDGPQIIHDVNQHLLNEAGLPK